MRQKYTAIMVLAVIIALAVYWYEEHKTDSVVTNNQIVASPVTVAKVKREAVPSELTAVGTLQATRQVDIAPQIAGQIAAITYVPGSYVKAGTVLIQLERDIYEAQLSSAESVLRLTSMDFKRVSQLSKIGATSRQLLDEKRAAYQQAQAAVKTNRTLLSQTSLRAPFAGYIGPKNFSAGDYVTKGEKLTTLTDRSQLLVNYQLPERYLPLLALQQEVKVFAPGEKDQAVTGTVSYISPIINQITHSVSVQATVANKKNLLAPGLFVKVQQITHVNQHALVIPQSSIVPTIMGPKVFVVESDKKVRQVSVKIGSTFKDSVEIYEGLTEGETVVTAGQQRLQEGSLVKEVSS